MGSQEVGVALTPYSGPSLVACPDEVGGAACVGPQPCGRSRPAHAWTTRSVSASAVGACDATVTPRDGAAAPPAWQTAVPWPPSSGPGAPLRPWGPGQGMGGGVSDADCDVSEACHRGIRELETLPLGGHSPRASAAAGPGPPVDGEPVPPGGEAWPGGSLGSGWCFLKGVWAEASPSGQDSSSKVDGEHVAPVPAPLGGLAQAPGGGFGAPCASALTAAAAWGPNTHTSPFV